MYKEIKYLFFTLLYPSVYAEMKSSLTFVIDDTGSMTDDIAAVKSGANDIFDTVMNSNASQIKDFVLVTFNDPKTTHLITTDDRRTFKRALESIIVDGGDDCPEMAMSGIKHALDESRPGSLLYIFTDASAKDPEKYDEVQRIAHKKLCQIVFVLTGTCYNSIYKGNHEVYDKLSASTDGQVFHLDHKGEVAKILKYVRTQIKSRKAVLFNKEFPPGGHSFDIDVDSKMKELVISVTGRDPSITVKGPTGEVEDTEDIVRTRNVAIVKVKEVTPGKYTAEVSSPTKTSVVVSAETTVHFQHGFSTFMPTSIDGTSTQPIPDEESYLSIELATDGDADVQLKSVQILDLDNNVITEQRLKLVNIKDKFYVSFSPVVSPTKIFRIAIKGYDRNNGEEVIRISLTPIEPQFKETEIFASAPIVTLVGDDKIEAEYRKPLQLKCAVRSSPRPDVIWENDATTTLKGEVHLVELPSEYMSVLNIDRVIRNGTYKCKASNEMGTDSKTITVVTKITDYFNFVKKPKSTVVEYDQEAKFECKVDAYPPAVIKWYINNKNVIEDDNIEMSSDGSLLTIKKMQPKYSGKYNCEAQNANERRGVRFMVHIVGVELPVIDKTTTEVRVKEGSDVTIPCRIMKGKPRPTIYWYFKDESSDTESRIDESDGEELHIDNVSEVFAGTYRCEAHNEKGYDYHNTELVVGYPPVIDKAMEKIIVKEGEKTQLYCEVSGRPTPNVKWSFNGTEFRITGRFMARKYGGTIAFKPTLSDVGIYVCEAENEYGSATKTIHLSVVIPPNLKIPKLSKLEKKFGDYIALPCHADGYPRPSISWNFHSFDKKTPPQRMRGLADGTLVIRRIQLNQQGYYTCLATNIGGLSNMTYTVLVFAPPSIEMENPKRPYIGVDGDKVLRVPCKAFGTPVPEVTWLKDGVGVPKETVWYDIEEDGTLVIKNLDSKSAGTYTCQAKNDLGVAVKPIDVVVKAYPRITPPSPRISIKEGDSIPLKCDVPHLKTDSIRWFKDNMLLSDEELYLLSNVSISDAGIYVCRMSNFVKAETGHIEVVVGSAPRFVLTEVERDILLKPGAYSEDLDCRATGYPKPKVTWFHNGKQIPGTSMIYSLTMTLKDRGLYSCNVENEHGRIIREYSLISEDCILDIWSEMKEKQPLMLSYLDNSWANLVNLEGYLTMQPGEPMRLYCRSGFTNFPSKKELFVECNRGTNFTHEDNVYKFSNFQCNREEESSFRTSSAKCLPADSRARTIQIGYNTDRGFIKVYEICIDYTRKPLFSKHRVHHSLANSQPEIRTRHDARFVSSDERPYNCKRPSSVVEYEEVKWFSRGDDCCFKKRLLVNPKDVFPGAPQVATYSNLNIVPQWSTCDTKNWDAVEDAVRTVVRSTGEELTVYTGIVHPLEDHIPVTPYIWKVVVNPTTNESIAIVQVNVPDVTSSNLSRWQRCTDICHRISWLNSTTFHDFNQGYVYCCNIIEFEREFGFANVFARGVGRELREVSAAALPDISLSI